MNLCVRSGLNSLYFHIIGDKLINPIVGVYIPIIRIPIKGWIGTCRQIVCKASNSYFSTFLFPWFSNKYTPWKLTWHWKIIIFNIRYIFIHGCCSIVMLVFGGVSNECKLVCHQLAASCDQKMLVLHLNRSKVGRSDMAVHEGIKTRPFPHHHYHNHHNHYSSTIKKYLLRILVLIS